MGSAAAYVRHIFARNLFRSGSLEYYFLAPRNTDHLSCGDANSELFSPPAGHPLQLA